MLTAVTLVSLALEKCAYDVLSSFRGRDVMYASNGGYYVQLVPNKTNIIVDTRTILEKICASDIYLIEEDDLTYVDDLLATLRRSVGWTSKVQVLFINHAGLKLQDVFEVLWRFYLVNALVLNLNLELYTYHPLTVGCKVEPVLVQSCFFPDVLTTVSFKDCSFKTSLFFEPPFQIDWNAKVEPGIFTRFAREIQEALGFKITVYSNYSNVAYGVHLSNGSYTGMFRDLYLGGLDYYVGGLANASYLEDFDMASQFFTIHYYFWVPKASKSTVWRNLLMVFTLDVWLSLAATFTLVILSCSILKLKEQGNFRSYKFCILVVWRTAFSINLSQPQSTQFKFAMLLWSATTYLLCSAFQSSMNSILFIPHYDDQIDTPEKLVDSKLKYGGSFFARDGYANLESNIGRTISQNFQLCGNNLLCLDRVAQDRDFVVLKDKRAIVYHKKRYTDNNGRSKLYGFPSEILFQNVVYMRKGHPLKQQVADLSLWFLQSGFVNKWDTYNNFVEAPEKAARFESLTFSHLSAAFVLLLIGSALAALRFCYELAKYRAIPAY